MTAPHEHGGPGHEQSEATAHPPANTDKPPDGDHSSEPDRADGHPDRRDSPERPSHRGESRPDDGWEPV